MIDIEKLSIRSVRHDYVIVQPLEINQSKNIILREQKQESLGLGTVLFAGPGTKDHKERFRKCEVKQGDVVVYKKYMGFELMIDELDVPHRIVRECHIILILDAIPDGFAVY